jgi:hypothetical protein
MGLTAGTDLGPYEVLEPIGPEGMGDVDKARDTRVGRASPSTCPKTSCLSQRAGGRAMSENGSSKNLAPDRSCGCGARTTRETGRAPTLVVGMWVRHRVRNPDQAPLQ